MNRNNKSQYSEELIDKLYDDHSLTIDEYTHLLDNRTNQLADYAKNKAVILRKQVYGNDVYIRGLIEISNICKNDCLYCGIRKSNTSCNRYRLTKKQILSCCENGYELGFRTFVLQGGEDGYYDDKAICDIVESVKSEHSDCAITLSLGERSKESYQRLYDAGADRYLLRHETVDKQHYELLHPKKMSYDNRIRCLYNLKEIGYQVGCGIMVGSPYQTNEMIAKDLKFIEEFEPDMCGIGPFIAHHATPFSSYTNGTVEETTFLLSLIRLIQPNILLPSTTALGTIDPIGREKGILAGANVIMPNLSPKQDRKKYELYDNKLSSDEEAAENLEMLKQRINNIGYNIVTLRGDIIK